MDTVASVEAGGSHMVVAICRNDEIVEREEFPTTTPQETLAKMKAWYKIGLALSSLTCMP